MTARPIAFTTLFLLLPIPVLFAQGEVPVAAERQVSEAERADAVVEFRRFFKKFKEVHEKVEAVRTLEGMESVEACDELMHLLDHKVPDIQKAAQSVLAAYRQERTFAGLVAALPDMKSQDQVARAIGVLGRSGIRSAFPVIAELVRTGRRVDATVKYEAARAAAQLSDAAGAEPLLRAVLDDSDALARAAAADSIGRLRVKELGPSLLPLLDHDAWQLQSAAVQALGQVREPTAVRPLVALMRKGGRLEEECANALFSITGMDFGTDADAWTTTWEKLESIPGWRIPTDEELAQKTASRKKYDAIYGKRENSTTFGGIPTTSTRVLFIIDVSGSMEDLVVQKEKFDAGYANYQKLTIVKTELDRTIAGLGPNTLFNIVSFASDLRTWKSYLAPANVVNKASARSWVERLKPIGGSESQALAASGLSGSANLAAGKTNTFLALMYPFGVDPEKESGPSTGSEIRNKLDTVFFLSDGRPTTGKRVDIKEILDEVRTLNEKFRIVFHCIAIGEFQKNFLKQLAEENGGAFVDLGH